MQAMQDTLTPTGTRRSSERHRQLACAARWWAACRGAGFAEIRAVAGDPTTAPPGGGSPARAAAMVRSYAVGGTTELDDIYGILISLD